MDSYDNDFGKNTGDDKPDQPVKQMERAPAIKRIAEHGEKTGRKLTTDAKRKRFAKSHHTG